MFYNHNATLSLVKERKMRLYDEGKLDAVLKFIQEYQLDNGKSPTYRQIMRHCKFTNLGTVFRYIKVLKDRGHIEKDERGSVAIDESLMRGEMVTIPLVGAVACGSPITAIENIEGNFALPAEFFGTQERFMLKATGSSMIEKGIYDGDILIVKKQNTADPGQVVIALIDSEATAKIYLPQKNRIILRAANSTLNSKGERNYPDIVVKECEILGVVDNCIHRL
jgi:repressor LexA